MNSLKNNVTHEFTGLTTEIVKSTNNEIIGKTGIVMNETKNMFVLKTKFGEKHIQKNHSTWKFSVNNNHIIIDGKLLTKRPSDRLEISV